MSFDDISKGIDEKMKIYYSRKWGKPDENGVVKHLKESIKEPTFREH